jgi:hypothetical protein
MSQYWSVSALSELLPTLARVSAIRLLPTSSVCCDTWRTEFSFRSVYGASWRTTLSRHTAPIKQTRLLLLAPNVRKDKIPFPQGS